MAVTDQIGALPEPDREHDRRTTEMPFAARAGVAFAVGTLLLVAGAIILARWPALMIDLRATGTAIFCL